jgi:hypothetical protein
VPTGWGRTLINNLEFSVFSTAIELRGVDLPFFSCTEFKKKYVLLKFDGL